jgi:hypothetical protein
MSEREHRALIKSIERPDYQRRLKRAMHGLSAVDLVKEIRQELAEEDKRRTRKRAPRH